MGLWTNLSANDSTVILSSFPILTESPSQLVRDFGADTVHINKQTNKLRMKTLVSDWLRCETRAIKIQAVDWPTRYVTLTRQKTTRVIRGF